MMGHEVSQDVKKGVVHISTEKSDLVSIIKFSSNKGLKIGKDVGVLSFNDTPLKEGSGE